MLNYIDRFESKFIPVPESGCWIWEAAAGPKGYGVFYKDRTHEGAHRTAWRLYKGEIPGGLHVLHKCDVPSCVNPDHLLLGTNDDNMQDKIRKGRSVIGKRPTGSANGNSKLDEAGVKEIKRLLALGLNAVEVSCVHGVCATTIRNIRSGKIWRNV